MTDDVTPSQSKLAKAFALHQRGELSAAALIYNEILRHQPTHPDALHLLGVVALQEKRVEDGIALIRRAVALNGRNVAAHNNLGKALLSSNRQAEAIDCFDAAIKIEPTSADAHMHRGVALVSLHRTEEALASYQAALALRQLPEVQRNYGHALLRLRRYEEAFTAYDEAYRLQPDLPGIEAYRLHTKMLLCDWSDLQIEIDHLVAAVRAGKANAQPFTFLAVASRSEDQLTCARSWVAHHYPGSRSDLVARMPSPHDRIRVAYLSADFRDHPTALAIVGLLECHDKTRFEITAISFGPSDGSSARHRIEAAVERFIDAGTRTDDEIAHIVRSLDIDIVIDLMGFTESSRVGLFARRLAPIQAHYMGYAGTTGASYLDYMIADDIVIPITTRAAYSESVVSLPGSFFVNDAARPISERRFDRAELDLPPGGIVFCCFNNSFKITPDVFDAWMDILKAVQDSVLWLSSMHITAAANLRQEAMRRGVSAERLIFAHRLPSAAEHLARYRAADLFLDTVPYNAHATASDALWSGLPVLTCSGDTFASRVAASLLHAIGLPELAVTTLGDYRNLAIELATQPDRLVAIKTRLERNRLTGPLFDTRRSTRNVEAAYAEMYRRHRSGLPPADIAVRN